MAITLDQNTGLAGRGGQYNNARGRWHGRRYLLLAQLLLYAFTSGCSIFLDDATPTPTLDISAGVVQTPEESPTPGGTTPTPTQVLVTPGPTPTITVTTPTPEPTRPVVRLAYSPHLYCDLISEIVKALVDEAEMEVAIELERFPLNEDIFESLGAVSGEEPLHGSLCYWQRNVNEYPSNPPFQISGPGYFPLQFVALSATGVLSETALSDSTFLIMSEADLAEELKTRLTNRFPRATVNTQHDDNPEDVTQLLDDEKALEGIAVVLLPTEHWLIGELEVRGWYEVSDPPQGLKQDLDLGALQIAYPNSADPYGVIDCLTAQLQIRRHSFFYIALHALQQNDEELEDVARRYLGAPRDGLSCAVGDAR